MVRACFAVKTPKDNEWGGLYIESNGNPRKIGKVVWDHLKDKIKKGSIDKINKDIEGINDMKTYLNNGKCIYCGKRGLGRPYNYPYHHHRKKDLMRPSNTDALYIEWVYVYDTWKNMLRIYKSCIDVEKAWSAEVNNETSNDGPYYKWVLLESISLNKKSKPNWKKIENEGSNLEESEYKLI